MPDKSQYAAAANIPLIKSPSLRVPAPVELPQDIHPLPESVTPYFVYPFTLEPHIVMLESSRRSTLAAHSARRESFLRSRIEEIEKRKRDALHKIAPGLGTMLVPTRTSPAPAPTMLGSNVYAPGSENAAAHNSEGQERDVMDDLVDQLVALESRSAAPATSISPPPEGMNRGG